MKSIAYRSKPRRCAAASANKFQFGGKSFSFWESRRNVRSKRAHKGVAPTRNIHYYINRHTCNRHNTFPAAAYVLGAAVHNRVIANLGSETRFREIVIWPEDTPLPPGTTHWSVHRIGREIGDIPAVPTADGVNLFSLEQTAAGETYLRGGGEDGIRLWATTAKKFLDGQVILGWHGEVYRKQ